MWHGLLQHAKLLKKKGYVTLIIDSFHRRRITDGCQHPLSYYPVQVRDAYAAFDRLAAMPFVDEDRIGYVGQSLGGGTALRLAQGGYINARTRKGQGTFAALVAYYPWCESSWAHSLARPVLILVGGKDDWTPADRCKDLHEIAQTGQPQTRPPVEGVSARTPFLRPADERTVLRGGRRRKNAHGAWATLGHATIRSVA